MEINGKVYRNLESQVGYLTDVCGDLQNQINDVRSHLTHYVIVDTLPTEDIDTSAVYLVGPLGTAPDTYYEEWVYVQLADESWTWEKLGDTDSIDLSGYLQKVETATTYPQIYAKATDGSQTMVNAANSVLAYSAVLRDANGQLTVPETPTADEHATSRKWVNNNFLAKDSTASTYQRVYAKNPNGTQDMINVSDSAAAYTMALRDSNGRFKVFTPSHSQDAANKGYVDDNFLAKQTDGSTYGKAYIKNTDGSQGMANVTANTEGGAIVMRTLAGQVNVPATPTDNTHAASKKYVDDAVGQLLYLHDIELTITVDASNKLYVKAYLVSSSATAITSFDRQLYRRIDVQWGAFGPDMVNAEAVAVSKLPDTFRQDEFDEPFVGFLYQYISGGNLISGKTDSNMSTTITDVVVSF